MDLSKLNLTAALSSRYRFLDQNSNIFVQDRYSRAQETRIYKQSTRNLYFTQGCDNLGRKWAWAPCGHRRALRVRNTAKSLIFGPSILVNRCLIIKFLKIRLNPLNDNTSHYVMIQSRAVDLGSRVIVPNNTLYTLQAGSFKLSLISYCFAVYTRLTGSPLSNHGLDPLLRDVEMQRARGDDMRRTRG